jgi:hypothetical protein
VISKSTPTLCLLLIWLCSGCSSSGFAIPYVVVNNGFTVSPIEVALSTQGEVVFQSNSCTGVEQSRVLHLTQDQKLRLLAATVLLRKLPGEGHETYRRKCSSYDERPLSVGIRESPEVVRWWSTCILSVDESFDRLPPPFQEIVRIIREIPESSYNPLLVLR